MAQLLVVHHTTSPATQAMLESLLAGTQTEQISGVDVVRRPALTASAVDVLAADAVVLGTPANIGYMSGALKHFFDCIYYPCLDASKSLPFGLYLHGNDDTAGARTSVHKITGGLGWNQAAEDVVVLGEPKKTDRDRLFELGATLAATIM